MSESINRLKQAVDADGYSQWSDSSIETRLRKMHNLIDEIARYLIEQAENNEGTNNPSDLQGVG